MSPSLADMFCLSPRKNGDRGVRAGRDVAVAASWLVHAHSLELHQSTGADPNEFHGCGHAVEVDGERVQTGDELHHEAWAEAAHAVGVGTRWKRRCRHGVTGGPFNLWVSGLFSPYAKHSVRIGSQAPPRLLLWSHGLPVNKSGSSTSLLLSRPSTNRCRASRPRFYPGFNFGLREMPNA